MPNSTFEHREIPQYYDISSPSRSNAHGSDKPQMQRLTFVKNSKHSIRKLNAENSAKHRQAIFTEAERQYMSNQVIDSVPGRDSSQALLDVERFECISHCSTEFSYFRGPFGVSRICEPAADETVFNPEEIDLPLDEWTIEPDVSNAFSHTELDLELIATIFKASDQENPQNNEDFDAQLCGLEPAGPEHVQSDSSSPLRHIDHSISLFGDNMEAWSILSHYKERIVPLISPLGFGQEASWLNLVMPCAINTLGNLTTNGSASHPRLAILNALLSTSAFYLDYSSKSHGARTSTGDFYLKRAIHHFVKCMEETCISPIKVSKYKEIVMVLLSLSITYMIQGNSEERLSCLIQAEKYISINGFNKPTLSSKRRTLHHCYAYMRIMAETTSINDNSEARGSTHPTSEKMVYTEFRLYPSITFSYNIMAMEKDPAVAQRDLHLAVPGRWSLTLFPKIYGIAESFLMLLSQVIRLANERDLSMQKGPEMGKLNISDFWVRAKALEKAIRVLLSCTSSRQADELFDDRQIEIGNPRVKAMYTALLIFFYRRIYDLDPALLQGDVIAVQGFLEQIQRDAEGRDRNMAMLIWPAFISACEAVQLETQAFFSSWFECCFAVTGLKNASIARSIIGIIWANRQEDGLAGDNFSWPDVLRATKMRLMCT
ncbi:Protein of unknown function DUF3468 [Penicillium angulare]|uniref:Protein of unknown function DUF3468 n=1 Tax=Penicillium angulare TaxID=116970 RepID=UPI002540D917|nr:Protein of unknown function DUF3468 [Penicillium angulare]KAJ5266648.1 Protein of unknown function DUF3468 [Penicillium angulare]